MDDQPEEATEAVASRDTASRDSQQENEEALSFSETSVRLSHRSSEDDDDLQLQSTTFTSTDVGTLELKKRTRRLFESASLEKEISRAYRAELILASLLASQDFSGAQRAWRQFVDLISHPEPTLRKAAIINIGGLFRKFPMWDVLSPRDAQGFVTALIDTVVGDEIIDIRLHAAKVLGSTLTISNYAAAAAAVGMFRRVSKARLPGSSAISDDQSQRKRIRIFVVEFIARAFNASAFPQANETRHWCFRSGTRPTQQLVAVVTSFLGPVIQFEQPEARLRCRAGILFVAYELLASREQLSPLVVANLLKMLEAESDLLVSQNDEADNASDFDFVDAEDADAFFEGDFACSDTLDVDLGLLQFCALFVPLMQDLLHDYKEDRRVEKAILTFLGIWASVFSRMDALEVRFRAAELRKECVTGFGALLGPHASRYEGFAKALAAADQEYAKLKVEVRRRVEAVRSVLQRPGTVVQLFAQKSDEAATASSTASHEAHAPVFASRTHGLADRICGIESMAMPVPTSERALVRVALRIPELPEVPEDCTTVPPMLFRPGTELIPVCTPSMLKAIPDLQDMAELGYSPYPPPFQGTLKPSALSSGKKATRPSKTISSRHTSLPVRELVDIEQDNAVQANPADIADPDETSAQTYGYLRGTRIPAGFLAAQYKNGAHGARRAATEPSSHANGWEPPSIPFLDADSEDHDSRSQDQDDDLSRADSASTLNSFPDTSTTVAKQQEQHPTQSERAELTSTPVPIVSAYHHLTKTESPRGLLPSHPILPRGEIEIWITETLQDPIRRFLGVIAQVEPVTSMQPFQHSSRNVAGGQPRYDGESAGSDDSSEDSAALTSALGSSDSGEPESAPIWTEDDRVEIRFRTSNGDIFAATVMIAEALEDDQDLEMWGSDRDESGAEIARSNPVPAALCGDGKVVFAPPCNFPPMPISYKKDSGLPLYGAALPLRKRPVACTSDGIFAFAGDDRVTQFERPLVYSNSGHPFYRLEGGMLPLPAGYTSTGVPFYTVASVILHPFFPSVATRKIMARQAFRASQRKLQKRTSKLIRKLQVAAAFMQRGSKASLGRASVADDDEQDEETNANSEGISTRRAETKGGTAQEGLGLMSDEKKDTKVADGFNNEAESEEGEEDEDEEDDDDDLILGTFVGGDTESFSQLSSESSERGTSSTSLMAALYSADPSDDPANGHKTVPLLFDRAVIEFTHTTTEETCKVTVQTKFAPKRDLDVFVMLDPPEVFEVVPAVLRFSPAVTSISLDIIFRPQRHTEKSSSVQGEIRVQEFSGQVLGTAELRGFCGPAFEVKCMLRRPLWIGPGQQTTFIVAVSNVTPKQLDVAIKIIANTDDVEDDTYETDENLAFAADVDSLSIFKFQEAFVPMHFVPGHFTGLHEASLCVTSNTGETQYLPLIGHCGAPIVVRGLTRQEQAIYAADPTDKTKAPVTLTRKRRSTLRAMDLEAPPTLSTLVDALERSPSGTAGAGATTKTSNTTGPGRRNMNAFVKKPWAQVRKLMGGLGGFRVQRRVPYDRPQDRPQENVPFLEELARTAVNYSVVGKSLQAADPKLTLRYRLQEHDDNSDGDSDDDSSVDSGPEWVNFDTHAKLDVDFGLVDPFQVIKRKFIIENMSSESSLVSLTLRGCPWIKLPNLLEVPARNQAIVDLELSGPGDWTGAFDFVIEITSMILRAPLQVRLIGFVGRALEFPLAPRTFFGIAAPSGRPVTLSLPVVNHSPYELHFLLLPLGTHFTAAIGSDPSTKTKIPALGCAWIEVSFSPGSFRGIYRSVLGVRVLHPVSITYAAAGPCGLLELVGVVAAPSGPQIPGGFDLNRIAALEAWIQETSPSSFVGPAGGSLDFARASGSVSQHTSELCRLCDQDLSGENRLSLCAEEGEPFSWHVVGRSSENLPFVHTHLGDYKGTSSKVVVEASVIAEDDSKLSVFASRGLVAESLGTSRALIKPENSVSDYPLRFGLVGVKHHLTVENFPSHVSGILVCQEGPISFNILPREGRTPVVNFGNCLAGASSRRWVTIRNWSSKPVRYVLDLGDMEDRFGYAPVQVAGQDQEGCLAPFAACFLPLTFKPESEGQLREMACVQAFSAEAYGQVHGRDAKREHAQEWSEKHVWATEIALVGNALVEAIHGLPEADELFDFGAVPVDSMTTRVWEPRNKGTTVQKLTFNVASPFTVSPALVTLEPEESAQVTISFHAMTVGSYLQELTCMANGKPMVFPLRGIVGELKASTSAGPSGLISYGTRKTDTISSAFVTITNKGSLPLELSRILYIGSPDLAWQLRKFQILFAGILPSYTETGQNVHIIERKHAWAILRRRLAHALRITRNKSVEAGMSSLTSQKIRMSMSRRGVHSRSSFKNSTIVYKVSGRAGLDSGFPPSQASKLQSSKRFQPLQQPSLNHKLARRQGSKILPASSMRSHEGRPGQMSMKRASPQIVSQQGSSGYLLGQSSHLLHPDKAAALMNAHADAELERFCKNGNTLIPIVPEIPSLRVFRPSAAIAKSVGSDVVGPEDTLAGRAKASTLPELPPLKPGDSYLFRIDFEGKLCVPLSVPVKLHFGPWQVSDMRMDLGLGDAEITNVKDCSQVLRFEGNAVRRLDLKPDVLAFKPTPAREHFPPDVLPEGNVLHIVATNASPHTLTFNCARCNNLSFEIPDKMIVVQPGSSVTVPIRFRPIHANTDYHANLALEDMFGRRNIRLSGRGAAAKVEAVTDVVRFPAIKIGKSATAKFILRNAGLFKSQIHISCSSEYFSLSQESFILGASGGTEPTIVTCTLPASARHSLRDTFAVEASLEVRWQLVPGGNWTTWLIPVSAEIGTVILEADAVECDLGLVTLNCASQASFRLRNLGTAPCEWTALHDLINASSGDCLNVELSASSGEIGAGQDTVLTIQFEPRTCDLLELVIPIESDGGNLTLRICGTVVAPQLVVPEDLDMDFGVILLEKRMQKGFKVENVGRIAVDVRAQLFIHNHTLEGSRKAKASRIVSMWGSSQEGATPTKVVQSAIRGRITELRHETSADREEALPDPDQADFVRGACFALGPVEAHLEPGESVTTVLEAFGDPSLPDVQSEAVNVIGSWVITAKQLVDVEWKGRLRARIGKLDANVEVPALLEGSRPREISAQDGALYSYFGVCMVNCEFLRRAACELVNHGTVNIEFLIQPEPRDMSNGDDSQEPVFEIQPRAGQLAPGERISIDVVFLAQTEGFHRLVTDVRFRPTGSAASSGGERLDQVVFCATSGVPRLVCLVGELKYGRCQIDGKPIVQTFQLQSAGNCPVSWSAKVVKGAEHFSLECFEGIISPQDDVLVPVKFSPRGACMHEDEDLLVCTGLLLVEWAGQTPFEIELCGEGARGRLRWSVEGETSEGGIQFGTQPIHAGCHPAWRSVHLQNEGQLGLDVVVRADLDGSVFAVCSREDERRQRDMEMQIERRFAQAELQQTLSGGALQVSRLMTQQALKTNSAARSIGGQNSKIFENEPVADQDMEELSRLSSTDSKSAFTRKFHLTPGDVTVLYVGFAPIVERTHHGELEIGIAGVSGCEQHILVEGSGGEFRITAEQAMQIDSVGVGFTTLDTLTLRNTGKLHSQVEVTVDPPEVGQQMTFTVEEVLVHADDAHTRTRPMHETEMMHQKAHEAGIHHSQFLFHGESTVRLFVGFFPTHVGQMSGALLIRPLHEGLDDAEDLLATSSRVRAKETAGTRRQNIVGPFGLVIPFSIDAVNNRLRLLRTSNVAMGRLACGQTCTDIRLLANGTDMEIDFSVRFSRQDAAWSVSPENGTLGPGTQVELHITFTTPREGESSGGKRDNAIDVDDWHEVEIEVLNETTGARDVCIRGYGAAGFPALQTNLDGQNRVDFGACQLNSAVSVPIVFRNVGTGMLHVQPRIEYESKEDHEQVLFIGWERPNSTHRDRSLPAQLDMAVGRSPEHSTYAKSLGDLLSHTGDGTGEGIDQPIFAGFGVLEPGAELRMMITFSPRFRGEVAAKLVIETNTERGRGGGASEVSLTGAGHSFDLHMDLLTNRIHFGTWMLGQSHMIKIPLRRRGDENVPVKILFDNVRYERAWPPPFGCGGILTVGEGTTGKAKQEPLQHELGHVRLSSAEVDVSGSETTEENVDEVELELSVPSSWLDNKLIPKRESIEAFRTLINAQPAPPAISTVSLFLLRPGSLPPYQIDVMFSFKFPRIAVELSEPVPSDGEKDRILIRDLGEIGRPGESVLAGLSEKDRSHVGAVIRFGSVLTRQAVAKSFVLSSDSPLRIPFKAQIEVQKHANSTENYNAFFSLSRKEGVLEAEEPMAIKLRCNFSIPFDATHNPALVRIQFLHGALPEMIIPIDVRTMDHVFSAVHLAPVKFVEPVFVGRAGEGILRLANVTGDPVEANITFGDAAFSLGGGLVNPVKVPAQEEPMEIAVHFLPSEDAAYDSSIDIQVDKMVFSVGISGIGSRAGLKLKPTNCVDFGFVGAMLRGNETLAVRNTSALPLLVEVDCAGIGGAWLDARPRHFTLKARSSQMVQLEFLPAKEASYDGALVIRAFEAESDIKEKDSSMKMSSGALRRRQLVEETVRVAGVGGRVSLAFPEELNFGRISTHIRQAAYLELANKGDVAMDVRLVARDVDGIAVVKFVPSELALLPGQSVDVNVLLTLQMDHEQSFWIDILPVVADAQDFGMTASNPYSWSLRVAAFGDKIDLSEEMQRILAEERLPKLAFRSDDVEDEHLRHVLRPVVQLPQASFAHLLRPVEPSLDAASVQFQNALARPAPLVSEVPQHATRPKWHENRAPLKLERSSRESAAQALSTSYTFSNARWKALFAGGGGGGDDDDDDLDHDNSGSRGGSGPHDENGGIHANHARRK